MSLPIIPLGLMGRAGTRSFPVLRSTSNHTPGTLGTSHTVNLPSGVQAGDLLVMLLTARSFGFLTNVTVSGWTKLGTPPLLDVGAAPQGFYRVAPSALTTASVTSTDSTGLTTNCYCFSEYSELPAVAWVDSTGASPNPPNLVVPAEWGSKPHCQFIASMHLVGNVTQNGTPSGYSSLLSSLSSNNNRTYSVRRQLRATSDNPSAFSITGTNPSSQTWAAATVAVRGT